MNMITNHLPTEELQALDAAHHMHPFTEGEGLAEKGARVITRANGVWITDSDGQEILDGMAGLWCVAIGYGRDELAEVAARQMRELPFYNTFFQTTHVPAIALARKLAELAPDDLNHVFFAGSGSEANDTNIRMVRHYWAMKGQPERNIILSRKNAYHGSSMGSGSLGGMAVCRSPTSTTSTSPTGGPRAATAIRPTSASPARASWKRRSRSMGPSAWRPLSASRCWAPGASCRRRRAIGRRSRRCCKSTTSCWWPTRW